jgi:hypothetical protein
MHGGVTNNASMLGESSNAVTQTDIAHLVRLFVVKALTHPDLSLKLDMYECVAADHFFSGR